MPRMTAVPLRSPEMTELERRVLAHERILQSLIAYMSRTEPRFLDHLRGRFVEPMAMAMAHHEHDYRDIDDDYAEELMRAVMLIGEDTAPEASGRALPVSAPEEGHAPVRPPHAAARPDRVRMKGRNGVWEIKVDDVFLGDCHHKEHALTAMALAKLSLR